MTENISAFCFQVFFASVRSGGSSQVFFMTLNRNSMMNWWRVRPPLRLSFTIGPPEFPTLGPPHTSRRNPIDWEARSELLTLERLIRHSKKKKKKRNYEETIVLDEVGSCRSHCYSTDWQTGATDFPNILSFSQLFCYSAKPFFFLFLYPPNEAVRSSFPQP